MAVVKRSADIAAPADTIIGIMLDVTNHHTWQNEVDKIEVLEADDQGRPVRTRVHVSAMGMKATYSLQYEYLSPTHYECHLIEGDFMTVNEFSFQVVSAANGKSAVTVSQKLSVKWPLPGFVIDQLTLKGVRDMLKALTQKAEAAG